MAKKKTQLDRIIDTFLDEMTELDVKRMHLADTIRTLQAQRDAKPPRKAKKEPAMAIPGLGEKQQRDEQAKKAPGPS